MTPEQFLPTRFVLNGFPSRAVALELLLQHRRTSRKLAQHFRSHCIYLGIWPLSLASRKRLAAWVGSK